MIRALLLILDATGSWEKIGRAQRGFLFITLLHLLPLMAITLGVEAYAMTKLGEGRTITGKLVVVSQQGAIEYAVTAAALNLAVILLGSALVARVGRSFHYRVNYLQCFTTLAYAISPFFLVRLLDALPGLNTWVCFSIGAVLMVASLYHAVPHVLRPDPAKAMGLYLMVAILLLILCGLAHFVTLQVLHGELNTRFWEQFIQ